ncbi:MAG TPA: hypothetical protein VGR57_14025, partial [Ktedonobacterales bacterium]|nr:hypothetical protein [Ktedonobacterales bacterium]
YNIRSGSNFAGRTTTAGSARGENPTRKQIRDIVQQYRKTLKGWDDELRALTGQRFFRIGSLDSQVYRIFVKKFGTFADEELGWDAQAADARSELRYQLFEEIRRERLRSRRFAAASAFWGLKKTSGYGTQPHLFIRSGLTILGLFTGLFFLNDYLNPGIGSSKHFCTVVTVQFTNWYDWPLNLARYLYVAVTNLSSLGSNSDVAHLCPGTFTQVLLIASALTGYFLLAMLAALFFRLLTESES